MLYVINEMKSKINMSMENKKANETLEFVSFFVKCGMSDWNGMKSSYFLSYSEFAIYYLIRILKLILIEILICTDDKLQVRIFSCFLIIRRADF